MADFAESSYVGDESFESPGAPPAGEVYDWYVRGAQLVQSDPADHYAHFGLGLAARR